MTGGHSHDSLGADGGAGAGRPHTHGHGHAHAPASLASVHRGRLTVVLALTIGVLLAEIVGAVVTGSLALLADAGHLMTDAAGIGLALLAIKFGGRPATTQRTYGFYRLEILAAVANAMLLVFVAGFVLVGAVGRFADPPHVHGVPMLIFAAGGLVANAVALGLLQRGGKESLAVRGAYLEVLGDLLGSAAVVVAAVIIAVTDATVVDPIVSVLVALMILPRVWTLLREAIDVLLEATPRGTDMEKIREHIAEVPGVVDVHDLHVWTITSGMPVMSVHVVVAQEEMAHGGRVLDMLHGCLSEHFDVTHSTFQLEPLGHTDHEPSAHP